MTRLTTSERDAASSETPRLGDVVLMRDSKVENGDVLAFGAEAWRVFVSSLRELAEATR